MQKKFYFYGSFVDSDGDYETLFSSVKQVKIDDYVVTDNGSLEPITVKVVKLVNEVSAITSNERIYEIIDTIDISAYVEKKKAEYSRTKLIDKMKGEIENIKLLDTLKKYSTGSAEMKDMYDTFNALLSGETLPKESES